ncbi:MAG: aspartate--tRNA ligase [Thermotogae bacterium]|nr:aspartate--tRNA ligase [Thermotogota bacterium]
MHRTHTCGQIDESLIDQGVVVAGWVVAMRELGALTFVVIRDRYGSVQVVFEREKPNIAHGYVIKVEGKVRMRPSNQFREDWRSGKVEVVVESYEVLNSADPLPFQPEDEVKASEEARLKFRPLDLRRPKMQENIRIRHEITLFIRNYLSRKGFLELETPILTKSTPEGARDFIVPSRLQPGNFYALPQSPQLYKQVLMVAGFDRYFQIARCFRDEDLRADRQPEFTQLDLEMSFVSDPEDVLVLIEELIAEIFNRWANAGVSVPFPRYTYKEVMERFGSDKPDLRYSIEYEDWTERLAGLGNRIIDSNVERGAKVKALVLPVTLSRGQVDRLQKEFQFLWFKVSEGRASGNLARFIRGWNLSPYENKTVFVFVGRGRSFLESLGEFRHTVAKGFLKPEKDWAFLWVKDFPLFYWNKEEGRVEPAHHIFTSPYEEHLPLVEELESSIEREEDPQRIEELTLSILGQQYDLVINGVEIGSGSIRVHQADLQRRLLRLIGLSDDEIEDRFGFLLNSFRMGAPPHGGIALGLDRIVAMCRKEESIREVILFPKTTTGVALFEGAPSPVDPKQLEELGIRVLTK